MYALRQIKKIYMLIDTLDIHIAAQSNVVIRVRFRAAPAAASPGSFYVLGGEAAPPRDVRVAGTILLARRWSMWS